MLQPFDEKYFLSGNCEEVSCVQTYTQAVANAANRGQGLE